MGSDWDMPASRDGTARQAGGRFSRGAIDPLAFVGFILRNIVKIAAFAVAFAVVGILLIRLIPFPYTATAVVLVDPREQNVTLQEDVLSPIGSDSAVLESMVQIARTDGFLIPLLSDLGMINDEESREDRLRTLAEFRKNLAIDRRGATYLVEITYRGDTPEDAARIANSVAQTFTDYHNGALNTANQNAAKSLSERLVELRRNVTESEQAVADYQARNNIIYLEQGGTVQKRQLSELSAQLATARGETEQARARYEEALTGSAAGPGETGEDQASQYNYLRQQRAQLERDLAELSTVYGPRHPRIELTRQSIANIDRQIADEGRLLTEQLKRALEVARARQELLAGQLNSLSAGVSLTNNAEVELEALRREAAADRAIYESFLNRNKATDELAAIGAMNVRVVSEAIAPLRSTRPSTLLLGPALLGLGFLLGSAGLVAISTPMGGIRHPGDDPDGTDGRGWHETPPPANQRIRTAQGADMGQRPYQHGTPPRGTSLLGTPRKSATTGGSLLGLTETDHAQARANRR